VQGPSTFTLHLPTTDPMLHYRVENSEDLVTWDTLIITTGTISSFVEFNGNGQPWSLPLDTTGIPKQFYRFVLDQPDSDEDGLPNWLELLIGTNPYQWDTDGDGIPDGWERTFNLNPLYSGDANATAAGGGMTNRDHYNNGSNPNNPPPLAIIVPGTAVTEQDASTSIYPANETGLLIQNGNFSTPTISTGSTYGFFTASATTTHWAPIFGTFIELQNSSANGTSGQYCELLAHWHEDTNPNRDGDPDHGIKQTLNLKRGNYFLIFDYRARQEGPGGHISGEFQASAQISGGTAVSLVVKTGTNAATTTWKRAYAPFEVKGGNPTDTQVGVTIQFDYAGTRYRAQSPFIDNVLLLPVALKLLNGQTQDFDGSTPTTLIPAPENPEYTNIVVIGTGGLGALGALPMGQGSKVLPSNAYVNQTQVTAKVPLGIPLINYKWLRFGAKRSWYIQKLNNPERWFVRRRQAVPYHDDTGSDLFYNSDPSPIKSQFYIQDGSGLAFTDGSSDTDPLEVKVGDFILEAKAFTYRLQFSLDGTTYFDCASMVVTQVGTVRYIAVGGTVATDLAGVPNLQAGNTVKVGTTDLTVTEAKVRAIVGGSAPIVISSNSNN